MSDSETELISRALCGIVDIGSNGIRLSISSKSSHHARIMPCVFKDRLGISLYEVQFPFNDSFEQIPIPNDIISEIVNAMKRFKLICEDFGVSDESVRVIATEATRMAINKEQFIDSIWKGTGWNVEVLTPEEETRITTFGLCSSYNYVNGLYLDLTGGSVQLSWVKCNENGSGEIEYCPNPINLPFGASIITKRLKLEGKISLFNEIKSTFIKEINNGWDIPQDMMEMANKNGGFNLLTRGGGLRSMGHLLLSQNKNYPIQTIISGTSIPFQEFESMTDYLFLKGKLPSLPLGKKSKKIFKVSEKRAFQLPAVAVLMTALFDVLPRIRTIQFSEGGIREGTLYSCLSREIRLQNPVVVASRPYSPLLSNKYLELLMTAIPLNTVPSIVVDIVAPALCNLAFIHASYPKELQPTAALHVATTGIISGCHGISHLVRALIGIALCNRWGGNIPDTEEIYLQNLENLVLNDSNRIESKRIVWWTKYIGTIMYVICGVHPGGNIRDNVFDFEVIESDARLKSSTKQLKGLLIDEALASVSKSKSTDILPAAQSTGKGRGEEELEEEEEEERAVQPEEEVKTHNHSIYPTEYEVLVNISKDDLKTSASVRARIITLQKKIRKLSRGNFERVKVQVQIKDE
ncbi:retrograde regulation protein 2 [Monosporozyma servazzii]